MAVAKPTTFANGRFLIEKELGKGGIGIVYQAFDRERDMRVALKTLLYVDSVNLHNLKREFRALHDLVHPNLCSFMELIKDDAVWFLTMELIQGSDFVEYVSNPQNMPEGPSALNRDPLAMGPDVTRKDSGKDETPIFHGDFQLFDEKKLRRSLAGLCEGLNALHSGGKIHRDVKPSNVLVTDEDRVVLLDFGFIAQKGRQELSEWGHIVGSPEFLAPEQAEGMYVGPAADMYSVGVMLYKVLTGELPFSGPPLKVILEKQISDPPRPSETRAGLPEDLEVLCMDLLNRNPKARPTPADILANFHFEINTSLMPSFITDVYSLTQGQLFVGRQLELSVLREAYQKTISVRSFEAVVIEGVSGVGKSTLVENFISDLVSSELSKAVLKGRCYERESAPFKAFDGVVDSLIDHIRRAPATEAAQLVPQNADLLVRLFPALSRSEFFANVKIPGIEIEDPHELQRRTFAAFKEVLSRLRGQHPLIVIIDDMQWVDDDSLSLLKFLVNDSAAPAMLLILLSRFAKEAENSVLDWDAVVSSNLRKIHVQTLNKNDSQELVRQFTGRQNVNLRVDAESIAAEADGHPLYILELVHHIAHGGEEWRNLRLDEVILSRVMMLPPIARELLEAICVVGTPIQSVHLQNLTGIKSESFFKAISLLRSNNLIRSSGPRKNHVIEPYHDRVREAVVAHVVSMGSSTKIHLDIGRFFLGIYGEAELEENIFFVVQHLHAGSELISGEKEIIRLAELYFLAGRKARGSSAFVSSLAYFKASIGLFSTELWKTHYDTMFELYCAAAESAYITGDFRLTHDLVNMALSKARSIVDKAKIYESYVLSLIEDGKPMQAIDEAVRMVGQLGVRMPRRPSKLYVLLKILTAKFQLIGKTREQLINLRQMTDPLIGAAIRILARIVDTAYFRVPNLNAMIVITSLKLTLRYGISNLSIPAFVGWGFINTAYLKNYKEGHKYGTIAIDMMRLFKDNSRSPLVLFVWAALVQHWREPLRYSLPYLLWGNEVSRETGELHYLAWSGNNYCYYCLLAGVYLPYVVESFEYYGREIKEKKQGPVYMINDIMFQTAQNLMGRSANPLQLSRAVQDDLEMVLRVSERDHRVNTGVYHFCSLLLQIYFDASKDAYKSAMELEKYEDARRGNFRSAVILFYDSLACLKYHGEANKRTKRTLLRRVRKNQRKYKKIALNSPANHTHKVDFIEAETARIKGRRAKALSLYDAAIAGAIRSEFIQDAALASEFAAEYCRDLGDTGKAASYARKALSCYEKWGAEAKVKDVTRKFNLSEPPNRNTE